VTKHGIAGDVAHPANYGALCVKGSALAESLEMPSRLLYPKFNGTEIGWDRATDIIAKTIHSAIEEHGPDSVAMYVSGQLLTEDYYVANKLMKGFVGTANIDTNSRLCMSSAVVAHNRAFGEDVVPVNYEDIDHAELLVICGANTAWTHPVLFRRIQQAREQNPHMRVVVIDPRKTVTAQEADLHIPLANDGDVALFNGLLRYCIDNDGLDTHFINASTQGFEPLYDEVSQPQYQIDQLSRDLSVESEKLKTLFEWFNSTQNSITLFCQGVNQSEQGSDKGNAIINAHLATGKIAKVGAGPFSITGQPNAMGGREVGGLANQLAVHRGFDDASIEQVQAFWNAPNIATKPGLKAVEMFEAVERGDIKFIWIMATNPVVSMPDNEYVKRALKACPMVVVSDITANADIAQYANLLLPAAGWGEKQGMVTNSERCLTRQRQFISPPGDALSDWKAISQVGSRLCHLMSIDDEFDYRSEYEVFKEYIKMTALNKHNGLLLDLSELESLDENEYDQWQPTQWGGQRPFSNGIYSHSDGKAKFINVSATSTSDEECCWWLNTGRQRDQWHTMTRTGHIAHLAATETEPRVYINRLSAAHLAIDEGALVLITQPDSSMSLVAKLSIDDALGYKQMFMSMHWAGEYGGKTQVNAVVSRKFDPYSGQPAFKSARVEVVPLNVAFHGLFIGRDFDSKGFEFESFQADQTGGIWRFASVEHKTKPFLLGLSNTSSGQDRSVNLDTPSGWLAVTYQQAGEERIIKSILFTSPQPIQVDYAKLAELIGKPLTFSRLLEIASSDEKSELVCSCFRVTDKAIIDALESGECHSLSQLQAKLKCGTNCGSCIPQVKNLVAQHGDIQVVMK
jgi:assimilatory nitrate reductase catalytic subunit